MDVAEPLASFDWDRPAAEVAAFMAAHDYDRVGIRREGIVRAYVERADLDGGRCGDHARSFGPDDLVPETASLQEVIESLGINGRCFVTVLDEVSAVVTLQDLEKPPVRMFLFGMITLLEMVFTLAIRVPTIDPERVLQMSRKAALRGLKELEDIRNNLAHGQELIAKGWPRIVLFSTRLDLLLESYRPERREPEAT